MTHQAFYSFKNFQSWLAFGGEFWQGFCLVMVCNSMDLVNVVPEGVCRGSFCSGCLKDFV
jgi:hypothetical protein